MAVSEINVSGTFLAEVQWAREAIAAISEAKIRDRPLGLDAATRQPDALFAGFARRDLLFYPYIRRDGFAVGSADAYMANIATLRYYIERERREEIKSVQATIQQLADARARAQPIGLTAPGGNLDEFASYFAIRELQIDAYLRGRQNVGEPSAYDDNIARLQAYLDRVNSATTH